MGRRVYSSERLVWALVGLGVLLRLAQYVANRSLWLDESSLALNIINRTFAGLLQPLDYGQGAPVGFLMLEKLTVRVFGNSEYTLRLVPLISGILGLLLFYTVAQQVIRPGAVPIALGLFAILDPLIYYSSEAKQYSSDVAVSLLVFSSAQLVRDGSRLSVPRALVLAIIGALALWFSHTAVFILMGVGTVGFMVFYRNGDWMRTGRLLIAVLTWTLSLIVFYYVSLRYLRTNPELLKYWSNAFIPLPPSLATARWSVDTFFRVFEFPVGLSLPGVGALTFLAGVIALWTENWMMVLALILPLFFALGASAFHLYPFGERLLLFGVPFIVLLIAEGTERIMAATKHRLSVISALLVGLLFLHPVLMAGSHLVRARTVEEIKPIMAYLRAHERQEDVSYLYYSAVPAFTYYSGRYGFAPGSYVEGVYSRSDWKKYAVDLDRLQGKGRVWVLFTHIYDDEGHFFLYYLDTIGTRLDSFESPGAAVYLYDLRKKGQSR